MLPDQLLAALSEPLRRPLAAFADEYLAANVPFGGRADELAALDAWLDDDERPCALVVAEAGRGKSALLARWVRRVAGRTPVVFVPVSIRFGTAQRMASLRLLAAQLRQLAGATGEAPRDAAAARAEIEAILARPRADGAPWLVVLDGIDEAVGWHLGRDLRLPSETGNQIGSRSPSIGSSDEERRSRLYGTRLFHNLSEPGPGPKLLISARALAGCDLDGWRRRLGWSAQGTLGLALPALDARGVIDVLRGMGDPLAALGDRREISRALARVSEGDPLVLRLYVDALRSYGDAVALVTPADLSAAPPGIDGYLDRWWAEQRIAWGTAAEHHERDARDLLCALAMALGPLWREDLDALVPARDPEVRDATLRALGRFVIGDGRAQGYVLGHPRLAYYHAERMSADERAAWERRFLAYGESMRARLEHGARGAGYVLRHHGAHLERSGAGFRELSQLVAPAWQRAWEALEGSFDGFLGDVERATAPATAALLEEGAEAAAAAVALVRLALVRASLHNLARNVPRQLLVGLVEAGLWSPAIALAYADGQEPAIAAIAHLLPVPLARATLATLDCSEQASWRDERTATLAALLRQLIAAGEAHEVLPALARQPPRTRARALLELAPQLPEADRWPAWAEIRAAIAALSEEEWEIDEQGMLLLRLAAQMPPDARGRLLEEAERLLSEAGFADEHVTLFGRAGAPQRALQLARDQRHPELRSRYLAHAVAGTTGEAQVTAFREWARAERALWSTGETVLRAMWPLPLPPPLLGSFVALALALPFPRERAFTLTRLALVHRVAISEALAAVLALEGPDRSLGLLALAGALQGPERGAALAEVLAAVRTRRWGTPSEAWHRADLDWQTPGGIASDQRRPRTAAELLATAALLLPRQERLPVLHEALSRSRTIADDGYRSEALTAMAAQLDGAARAEVLAAALAAARAETDLMKGARALAMLAPEYAEAGREAVATLTAIELGLRLGEGVKLGVAAARSLPEPEQTAAIRALFEVRAAHRDDDSRATALTALAPCLPGDLLERAARNAYCDELSVLAAHGAWPGERQLAVVTAAVRAIEVHAGRPPHVERGIGELAPRLSMPLLRDALALAERLGQAAYRTWLLNVVLPRLAELGEPREAVELARTFSDPLKRAGVLGTLIPHLAPPLRDVVVGEVMARVRALAGEGGIEGGQEIEVQFFLERVSVLAAHGHCAVLAVAAGRLREHYRAISVWMKLAAAASPPERRAVLAVAAERVLAAPGEHRLEDLTQLLTHAADLDRRSLAQLFDRALWQTSHGRRDGLFIEDTARPSSWVARSLAAFGGQAAILDTARAYVEVAEWFP